MLPSLLPAWLCSTSRPRDGWAPAQRLRPLQASPPDPAALAPWRLHTQLCWLSVTLEAPHLTSAQGDSRAACKLPRCPSSCYKHLWAQCSSVTLILLRASMAPAFLCYPHPSSAEHTSPWPIESHVLGLLSPVLLSQATRTPGDSTNKVTWLESLPAAAPLKPSLPPASHPSPICLSHRPRTGGDAPEHSCSQPTSTHHPGHCPAFLPSMTDANMSSTLTDMFPICFSPLKRSSGLL